MSNATPNLATVAEELAAAFITKTRDNGESFVTLKDEARDTWIQAAVFAAHDDAMPNDSIYAMCGEVADTLAELLADEPDTDSMDSLDYHSRLTERLDSLVAIYYSDIMKWQADNPHADAYQEQAVQEGLYSVSAPDFDLMKLRQVGMFEQYRAITDVFMQAIQTEYEGRTEAE